MNTTIKWDGEKADIFGWEIHGIPGFLLVMPLAIASFFIAMFLIIFIVPLAFLFGLIFNAYKRVFLK